MEGSLEFRIVDGILYFMGDMASQGKWMKLSLADAAASSMGSMGSMTSMASPETAKMLEAFANVPGLVTASAEDGPEVDGEATRAIKLNIDLGVFITALTGPEGKPIIKEILASQGQTMTDAEIDAQMAQVKAMVAMLEPTLKATTLQISWMVGTTDQKFHGFALLFDTTVDPTLASMMSGGAGTSGAAPQPIKLNFNLTVTLSKLGEAVTVEAVADAVDANPKK
jgi:methionine-rich copper-binding protein CopC